MINNALNNALIYLQFLINALINALKFYHYLLNVNNSIVYDENNVSFFFVSIFIKKFVVEKVIKISKIKIRRSMISIFNRDVKKNNVNFMTIINALINALYDIVRHVLMH